MIRALSALLIFAASCAANPNPAPTSDTSGSTGTPDSEVSVPLPPAGLAAAAFVRIDGGDHTSEDRPRVAATAEGDGFYVSGRIRAGADSWGDSWIARLDRDGAPRWHHVRERPFDAYGEVVELAASAKGPVFLHKEQGQRFVPERFVLVALDAEGFPRWERVCAGPTADFACRAGLDEEVGGTVVVGGDQAVLRFTADGDFEEVVPLELGAPIDAIAARPDGTLLFLGRSETRGALVLDATTASGKPVWQQVLQWKSTLATSLMAVAPDGRIAVGGWAIANTTSVFHGFGWVVGPTGTPLFELPDSNLRIGGLAFGASGDLFVGAPEGAWVTTVPVLANVRRMRLGPEGQIRWSAARHVVPYDPTGPRETVTGTATIDGRVVFVGSGPSSERRDSDVFIEVLEETDSADVSPDLAPTEVAIPRDPVVGACRSAKAETSFDACGIAVRVRELPAPSGFEVTPGPAAEGAAGAVSLVDGAIFFRTGSDPSPVLHWQPVGPNGLAVHGNTVVVQSSGFIAEIDASDPAAPAVRCLAAPAGLPFAGSVAVGERWLVATAGETDTSGTLIWYFDRLAAVPTPIEVPIARTKTRPLLDGHTLFIGNDARVRLFRLAAEGPKLLAKVEKGFAFGTRELVLAGGFAIDRPGKTAWDLDDFLEAYGVAARDCGFDVTLSGGEAGFSVVAGRTERLALGSDLGCLAPAGGGSVAAEPGGTRVAMLGAGSVAVVDGSTVTASAVTDASSVGWLGDSVVLEWPSQCDLWCPPTRWEIRSPELGEPKTVLSPSFVLAQSDDDTRRWLITYQDGQFPSDDGGSLGPSQVAYLDPAAGLVVSIPTPTVALLLGVTAAPGRLYVTHADGRIWRLDSAGNVLAETRIDPGPHDVTALAAPGLGLFVHDSDGRVLWLDDDLKVIRSTSECFPIRLHAASEGLLYAIDPLRGGSSTTRRTAFRPLTPSGGIVQSLVPVATSETAFHFDVRASYPADGQPLAVSAGAAGLWVYGRGLALLTPDALPE